MKIIYILFVIAIVAISINIGNAGWTGNYGQAKVSLIYKKNALANFNILYFIVCFRLDSFKYYILYIYFLCVYASIFICDLIDFFNLMTFFINYT